MFHMSALSVSSNFFIFSWHVLVSSIFHQLPRKVPAFCFRCFFVPPFSISKFQKNLNSNSKMQATIRLGSRLCRFYSLSWLIHVAELLWQLERGYETLCNIFRFATNVNSFWFHFISRFHFLHKSQAFDFTSFFEF